MTPQEIASIKERKRSNALHLYVVQQIISGKRIDTITNALIKKGLNKKEALDLATATQDNLLFYSNEYKEKQRLAKQLILSVACIVSGIVLSFVTFPNTINLGKISLFFLILPTIVSLTIVGIIYTILYSIRYRKFLRYGSRQKNTKRYLSRSIGLNKRLIDD